MSYPFTFKELLALSHTMRELAEILGRPPGVNNLTAVQRARGERVYALMMSGEAKPGELLAIATGESDPELGFAPRHSKRGNPRTECIDCGVDIRDPASRMKSDPTRCTECRRAKKREYNAAQRGKD